MSTVQYLQEAAEYAAVRGTVIEVRPTGIFLRMRRRLFEAHREVSWHELENMLVNPLLRHIDAMEAVLVSSAGSGE